MPKHTTLITGASAGIGLELARRFAREGHDLILVARRKTLLNDVARTLRREHGVSCIAMPTDLAAEGACEALFDQVNERGVEVGILVNNAGVLRGGAFRRGRLEDFDSMIELNIAVPTRLCRLFLDGMLERGAGRIVNVASIAAFQPVPTLAVYAATKAYVLSFTDALTVELKGKGVTATAVCPGFTDTDMMRDADGQSAIPGALVMQPEAVAHAAYAACMNGDAIEVPGIGYYLATSGMRLLPRWLVRGASGLVLRRGSRRSGG